MPLVLTPAITDQSRSQIESHLTLVRSRRMNAAIHYHQGRNAKLERQSIVIQRRIDQQWDRLAKYIAKLDKADELVQKQLNHVLTLVNNLTQTQDMMVTLDSDDAIDREE